MPPTEIKKAEVSATSDLLTASPRHNFLTVLAASLFPGYIAALRSHSQFCTLYFGRILWLVIPSIDHRQAVAVLCM